MFFKVNNIIVADPHNNLIKNFSSDGSFLMKIGEQGSFTFPIHCVQCDRYLIVSDYLEHGVKVFNYDGNFQHKFGKQGGGHGELNYPCCLSVNKSGHLMVCDSANNRIQVNTGRYLNSMELLLTSLVPRVFSSPQAREKTLGTRLFAALVWN